MIVSILGADGSGKSTVIKRLIVAPPQPFREVATFHLRPGFCRTSSKSGAVDYPHEKPPRNLITSALKLILFALDYWTGFMFKVGPLERSGCLVIFDRYFQDLLVDPKRYRYGAPLWLAQFTTWMIPSPDLWILLDAPAEVLQVRKQEVPFTESARQRDSYLKLFRGMKSNIVIDASQPLDAVIAEVANGILNFTRQQTSKRLWNGFHRKSLSKFSRPPPLW